jgi:hypothetical protein
MFVFRECEGNVAVTEACDEGASWEVSGCPLTVRACVRAWVRVTSLYVGTVRRDLEMPTSLTNRTSVKGMH